MKTSIIELSGMTFKAYHGCLEDEKMNGNTFIVDFKCEYDTNAAEKSDKLEDTLDYSEIYDIVAGEMAIPSNLLECVAGRIADSISARHPELTAFEVRVTKKNPPVAGHSEASSITIRR